MYKVPSSLHELITMLRQPSSRGRPRREEDDEDPRPAHDLSLLRDQLAQRIRELSPLCHALLSQTLTRDEVQRFRQARYLQIGGVLLTWSVAVKRTVDLSIPGLPAESEFVDAREQMALHRSLVRNANRARGVLVAVRRLLTRLQKTLLRELLAEVDRQLRDPGTSRSTRQALRRDFEPLLQQRERVARMGDEEDGVDRVRDTAGEDPASEGGLTARQAEALRNERQQFVQDVMYAVRMGWPVDAATLWQAALWHHEDTHEAPHEATRSSAAHEQGAPAG